MMAALKNPEGIEDVVESETGKKPKAVKPPIKVDLTALLAKAEAFKQQQQNQNKTTT